MRLRLTDMEEEEGRRPEVEEEALDPTRKLLMTRPLPQPHPEPDIIDQNLMEK